MGRTSTYSDPSDVPRAFRPVKWQQLPNRAPWQMGAYARRRFHELEERAELTLKHYLEE